MLKSITIEDNCWRENVEYEKPSLFTWWPKKFIDLDHVGSPWILKVMLRLIGGNVGAHLW